MFGIEISNRAFILLSTTLILSLTSCTTQQNTVENKSASPEPMVANNRVPTFTPTPDPFQEMTIPYLREQTYTSSLGTLQKFAGASTHTTYTTSYISDGLKINALLTQPTGEKPPGGWPAIVFVHGYIPPTLYRTTEKYVEYVNTLARNGYVVFKIDLRGHGNSEGEAGGGYYSADYVIDTLNAYAALSSTDFVDPQRVGLWGHSMAGNVLLRTFAAKPDIPAVDIWAGAGYTYQDLRDYRINDNSYRPPGSNSNSQRKRDELFKAHGQFDPNNDFWKQVAPSNYLNDLKGALQLNHAVDDTVVSINYSRNLNNLLNNTQVAHELHEYPSGGHNISGANFTKSMEDTVNFYNKYLK